MATVLVVDDDEAVRELITDTVMLAGHRVEAVACGPEALAFVAGELPDCVVLDVMMPRMSGLEVLATWRRDPRTERLPVIMLTARVDDTTTWQGWQAGADIYLPKPFNPDQLALWVDRLVPERAPAVPDLAASAAAADTRSLLRRELHLLTGGTAPDRLVMPGERAYAGRQAVRIS